MYATRNLSTSRAILAVAALAIAFGFAGCKSAPATPTDDAGLTAALQSRIAGDAALSNEPIQSSVQKQVATLNGTVSNEAARSLAAADAAQVPGVKTVVNNLTVQAPAPAVTAAAPPPPPRQEPPPPPPPAPAFRNITLNPGTTLPIRITQTLDSATTQQGETFNGTIASDIVSDGVVVIRTGTPVTGRVVAVQE